MTMTHYEISNNMSAHSFGIYEGETALEAYTALLDDASARVAGEVIDEIPSDISVIACPVAAIGDDGLHEIVWGIGSDEAAALADALHYSDGRDVVERYAPVTGDVARRIVEDGDVRTADLGLALEG
jgi:hypothetical protein